MIRYKTQPLRHYFMECLQKNNPNDYKSPS